MMNTFGGELKLTDAFGIIHNSMMLRSSPPKECGANVNQSLTMLYKLRSLSSHASRRQFECAPINNSQYPQILTKLVP